MSRVVLVTGGGTGIGLAVAERFAQDGDRIVLVGRRAEVLDRAAKQVRTASNQHRDGDQILADADDRVRAIPTDLTDPDQVERLRQRIAETYGRVDVLVNTAGGNAELDPPDDVPAGLSGTAWQWTANFRLNVLSAVLATEAVKDLLADHARVLLFSSIAAFRGSGSGSYAAAKAALHPYAIDLAGELGGRGITVNVIAPGYIAGTEFFRGQLSDERERTLIGQTLNQRVGTVSDVAATAHWLASPAAGHVDAQIVQVNGGALAGR
jgi:NAD(P)-dependent dehydrogenase (short-subunit alcohol dehydrogenase family)